jgi:hypothetical protein
LKNEHECQRRVRQAHRLARAHANGISPGDPIPGSWRQMSGTPSDFEESCSISDPFHGDVWLAVSREASEWVVRVAVSIMASWDVDLRIEASGAQELAEALGGTELGVVRGRTVDGDAVVIAAQGDRLAVTVLGERLCDVLTLGEQARTIRGWLSAAAQPAG